MPLTYRDQVKLIGDALRAVPQIGRVHEIERAVVDWKAYLESFMVSINNQKQVRGWWLVRESREDVTLTFGTIDTQNLYVIRGIMRVHDSDQSQTEFHELVDDVMDTLTRLTMSGAWTIDPCQMRTADVRQFSSVLCHYVELTITVHIEWSV